MRRHAEGCPLRTAYGRLARVELDDPVGEWLTIQDVAQRLGTSPNGVRRLLEERDVLAVRRGSPKVLMIPAGFLAGAAPLPALKGTVSVLTDAGFSDEEIVEWLFAADPTLPGDAAHAVAAMHAGFKTEIRRRAMEAM